jgi:hypothetical protein
MRRYRRNADAGIRRLERAFRAGDPDALRPYVAALRKASRLGEAAEAVRVAMVQSGKWRPWPTMRELFSTSGYMWQEHQQLAIEHGWHGEPPPGPISIGEADALNGFNFDLASVDEPIAAPWLLIEEWVDGDIETRYFNDGPYVVEIDGEDPEYINRQMDFGDMPVGERGFIPLWRVKTLHPPPFGIPQAGYDMAKRGYGPDFMGAIDLEESVAHVDGVSVAERPNLTWENESGEFLCTQRAMRLM